MPFAAAQGASLYYEDTGTGTAIVFAHEYAAVRGGSEHGRCCGPALHTMRHPERVAGLVFASGGSGSEPTQRERFVRDANEMADMMTPQGIGPLVEGLSYGATRVQLLDKDPRAWGEFRQHLSEHSVQGAALTMRNCQGKRPSIQDFEARLRELTVPTLIVVGDEDDPVIETSLFLKRVMPAAGMVMFPKTGHAVNLEEPAAFNAALKDFFGAVERDNWGQRNPLARPNRPRARGLTPALPGAPWPPRTVPCRRPHRPTSGTAG